MTASARRHLWLALSPHGFGHAAMTSPVIAALRRRCPDLRLTIQTGAIMAPEFLRSRYGDDFTLVADIPDFGLRMRSSVEIDLDASAEGYRRLHAHWPEVVEREAERLRRAAPDLVLANIPYVTVAAAALAGIPVVAMSSLQWADMYRHYLSDRPEAATILGQMVEAYDSADLFLRVTPAMEMPSLARIRDIGPVGVCGQNRRNEVGRALGCSADRRVGLIAFGGIDHEFNLGRFPKLAGWSWLTTLDSPEDRGDIRPWRAAGMAYVDMAASVDVIITKPGYGTFVEAAMAGIPVLYLEREDWPECPHLDDWLKSNGRALAVTEADLVGSRLEEQLRKLFSLKKQDVALPRGNEEAASLLAAMLDDRAMICERS
ncbi:hypothetical protein CU669_07495 [Paramagnetospirillum kuznetsovii]|uniref:Glycosyl transferase n=1 Tax=Paramagnetospirillum kuznetsovii TaxID=2053833 RepID=A0A364NZN3_9PROT|nr:hypothetical protein [Paramagnetospirillum kuznetsovii]RAU22526.1 hypothetical protein CU669_07495 [Paramagnetospirillum kuznetsovii]